LTATRTVPILDAAVRELLDRVRADPRAAVAVGMCAPGGYGKTTVLHELDRCFQEAPGADPVLVVDDAHRLTEAQVRELIAGVPGRRLAVAYRPWPRSAALAELISVLHRHGQVVTLSPFGPAQVHELLTAAGVRGGPRLAESVGNLTGGVPALVDRTVAALGATGGDIEGVPEAVAPWLRRELEALEPRVQLCLVAAELDVELLGRLLGGDGQLGTEVLEAARATGLLGRDGTPVPLVRRAIAALVPAERRIAVRRRLAEIQLEQGGSMLRLARSLLGTGAAGPVVAAAFEAAADEALPHEPALSAQLYAAAAGAARPAPAVATRWARAAALAGDVDSALRIADQVVTAGAAADRADAARVAAAALAHRGQLAHSAELYRWSGSAELAAVGFIGTGRLVEVPPDIDPGQPPTLLTAAAALMAHGVRESVTGSQTSALAALVRAADLLQPTGRTALLPDSPAALAALVALHAGEWAVAESVLDRAAAAGLGGGLMATRHHLLRAWALLVRGDIPAVRELRATFGQPPREPRDWLFWVGVELGLARRDGDLATLRHTWANACEAVLRHPVDLFTLLPLGEFAICAARLGDHDRMAPHLADAYALLDRLDGPALWTASLRWSALQAAIIAEQPAAAREHATALAATAPASGYFRALSGAAGCWLEVLAGTVDAAGAERAARGLHDAGLRWDGSRLAAQAAVRTADRKAMVALLDCARTLQGRPGTRRPAADPAGPGIAGRSAELSDREWQVASLVVAGLTYKQIADRLYISPKTIEHHVARMRRRLGCENRADLLARLRHLNAGVPRVPG
jgi:DNA-binding CsgD family transcriptional regulator